MNLIVEKTEKLKGEVMAPPSKSHSHRAIIIASLSNGTSRIHNSLMSQDILSTINSCTDFGAVIKQNDFLEITGVNGKPVIPERTVDVGNSGTTIRLLSSVAALCDGPVILTGDESIQKRPIGALLSSLDDLGAQARCLKNNDNPPVEITGKMKGGNTTIEGISSQYLSSLLIACPLAEGNSRINVVNLKSSPYVEMTLAHLSRVEANIRQTGLSHFEIQGGQTYRAQDFTIPGDFSSAAFILAAGHITNSDLVVKSLINDDTQGDKFILDILQMMKTGNVREIDLSKTPDLLPITAVLGCYASGTTILKNVEHARIKECDRIAAITKELKKMGASIEERPDGLVVEKSELRGCELEGHRDHRIIMALAVAGLGAESTSIISNAEDISISFPNFVDLMRTLGADIHEEKT